MPEFWQIDSIPRDAPALIVPGQPVIRYGRLAQLADEWCKKLVALAQGGRPIVALEFGISVDAVAAYIGALRAALPVLVIEPGQLGPETQIRTRWTPDIIIAEHHGRLTAQATNGGKDSADKARPHDDLRLLLSTSGSTGDPKLVRLSGGNIASNAVAIAEYLELTPADRAMSTLPFFYSYGLSVLHSYLQAGAALILTERSVVDPAFWDEFRDYEASSMALVPHQFDLLERCGFGQIDLPSLRYITQAGGKLAQPSVLRFADWAETNGWDLVVMYGQTEASPRISYVPPRLLKHAPDTIGCAIPGGRLWLCDERGQQINAAGVAGELVYEGPNVMMGYAEQWPDLARGAEVSELRTGDIAERTTEGLFRIVGRLKRFVKLFGLRISLDQVEVLLRGRDIVAHALAVDEHLVVLHREPDQGDRVRDVVAAEYALPTTIIHTGHLAETPLLPSGKHDQRALQQIAAQVLSTALAQPQPTQQSIAGIIAEATRSRTVAPQDSFASLGGDSLSYLHVQMALETRLGQAPEGWENMPISALDMLLPSTIPASRRGVGVDVLLRLFAIIMVIAQHASDYRLFGGAWMLIALMGYSAARFQYTLLTDGKALRFATGMLYPIVPLYFMLLLPYGLLRDSVPITSLLLVGNYYIWPSSSLLEVYWFVSLYVQIVLLLTLAALTPRIRRAMARAPWTVAAAPILPLLAIEAALMLSPGAMEHGVTHWPWDHYASHGFIECLPVFLLGWMLQKVSTVREIVLTGLLALGSIVLFSQLHGAPSATIFLILTLVLLAFKPVVVLPSGLAVFLQKASVTTLFVYLLHEIVVFVMQKLTHSQNVAVVASVIGSFALAFLAKGGFDLVERQVLKLIHGRTRQDHPIKELRTVGEDA